MGLEGGPIRWGISIPQYFVDGTFEPAALRSYLARAEALGVATVLDPTSIDVPAFLRENSDGLGVDMAIECSGHPSGFDAAIRSLRRRGTLAQTGLFVGEASVEPMLWALNDLTIVGTWCYWVYDFDRIAAQISAGDLPVERVVANDLRNRFAILRGELIQRYDLCRVRMATSQARAGRSHRHEQGHDQGRDEPKSSTRTQRSAAQRCAHELLRRRGGRHSFARSARKLHSRRRALATLPPFFDRILRPFS